jgi:hypothetical protein
VLSVGGGTCGAPCLDFAVGEERPFVTGGGNGKGDGAPADGNPVDAVFAASMSGGAGPEGNGGRGG